MKKEITNSILERKKIEVTIYNAKQNFISINYLKKIMKIDENINKDKTWARIELYLNDILDDLFNIEKIISKYPELFANEFNELKNKLHKEMKRLPLINKNVSLIA